MINRIPNRFRFDRVPVRPRSLRKLVPLMLAPLVLTSCLQLLVQSANDWAGVARQAANDAARDGTCEAGASFVTAASAAATSAEEAAENASNIGDPLQSVQVASPDFLVLLTRVEQAVLNARTAYERAQTALEHARNVDEWATATSDRQGLLLVLGAIAGPATVGISVALSAAESAATIEVTDAEAEAAAEEALQSVRLAIDQLEVANRAVNELRSASGESPTDYADEFAGIRARLDATHETIEDQGPALRELERIVSFGISVGDSEHVSVASVLGELEGEVIAARRSDAQSTKNFEFAGEELHYYEADAQAAARRAQEAAAQAYAACNNGAPPPETASNPFGQGAGFNQDLFGVQGTRAGTDGYVPPTPGPGPGP